MKMNFELGQGVVNEVTLCLRKLTPSRDMSFVAAWESEKYSWSAYIHGIQSVSIMYFDVVYTNQK